MPKKLGLDDIALHDPLYRSLARLQDVALSHGNTFQALDYGASMVRRRNELIRQKDEDNQHE